MKMDRLALLLLVGSAALVPAFASGGDKTSQADGEVKIGPPPYTHPVPRTRMSGSVMAARNSVDSKQHIGCTTSASFNAMTIGTCWARTATGNNTIMCSTTDPALIQVMGAISDTSFVAVDYETNTGNCVRIDILNSSKNVAAFGTTPISSPGTVLTGFQP